MRLLTTILTLTATTASAHPGHLVDAAGHITGSRESPWGRRESPSRWARSRDARRNRNPNPSARNNLHENRCDDLRPWLA